MIARYINSVGKIIDLLSFHNRVKDINFHEYEWEYDGTEQKYGLNITNFKRSEKEYEGTIVFRGSLMKRKENLNNFLKVAERDILSKTPGKLICGDYYINAYVVSSSTYPDDEAGWTLKDVVFLCPYPFWIKEEKKQFFPQSEPTKDKGLDYKYDYEYDYTPQKTGTANWYIDHYAQSEFNITIYGPCTDPRILINGYPYEVFDTIENNEYIIIDSRNNTIIKYLANGTQKSIYDLRSKAQSIFNPVSSGDVDIAWNGEFGFDITLYLERSEPEWN